MPTLANVNPMAGPNYTGTYSPFNFQNTVANRVDHRFSDNDTFYARYSQGGYARIHLEQDHGLPIPTGEYANVARNFFDQTAYETLERWQNTGWGNSNGMQLELERRYAKGFAYQLFYVMDNAFMAGGNGYQTTSVIPELNQFPPGQVPTDIKERNKFLNYQRDR